MMSGLQGISSSPAFWLFGLGAAWLVYVYAGYPLVMMVLAAVGRKRRDVRDDFLPSVSVLIAARNEEQDIGWKIEQTLAWDYPPDKLEILVASDASEDRTDEIVRAVRDTRVKLVRMEKRGGKVRALNRLVRLSSADLLFFTDANSHIDSSCLRRVVRHFADPQVGCVTGRTECVKGDAALAVGSGASVYWDHESRINELESALGSVLVCDGAIHCARRWLYGQLLPELANDLELPLRIRSRGFMIVYEPSAITLESDTPSAKEEFARRRRICGQGALALWKLGDLLHGFAAWQFVSRKVLRWLTAVPLAFVFVGSLLLAGRPLFASLAAAQLVFYAAAGAAMALTAAGRPAGRILSVPFYATLGAAGALAGVVDTLRGRKYDVWEIPSLSRGRDVWAGRAKG